ncbi:MAG: hypothetical protein ACRC2H_13795 [Silanimonas sp.]
MITTTPVRDDDRLTPPIQRYLRWFAVASFSLVVLLPSSLLALLGTPAEALAARVALSLVPALPIGLMVWAFVRYVREADEMQRLIELQSLAIAGAFVGMAFLVVGLLDVAGVLSLRGDLAAVFVSPGLATAYGITKLVVDQRYRA